MMLGVLHDGVRRTNELTVDKWPMSVGDGRTQRRDLSPRLPLIAAPAADRRRARILSDRQAFWVTIIPSARSHEVILTRAWLSECTSKGPELPDGCPWDAIEMIPTDDWEAMHGIVLPDPPPPPPAEAAAALPTDQQPLK